MFRSRIFNHDIMHCTHEAVEGNYLYSGRVLGLTEPDDIIQLHPDLQSEWRSINEHYAKIGLSHTQNVIWDVSFDKLVDYSDRAISVFIFGDAIHQNSNDDRLFDRLDKNWLEVVEYINSKNNFIELAEKLEVPIPKTWCFAEKSQIDSLANITYPCYLKPAISVDGVGISRCNNQSELTAALETIGDRIPIQIQAEVKANKFLNLQYSITKEGVRPLAATEQVLEGFAHSGNRYPTVHQPWQIVEPMAKWMAQQGMKEIFAFDVAVDETDREPRYFAIECNPRFNGASYPTGIANKLKIESWVSETLTTKHRSLQQIDLSGIEFDLAKGKGVIIVNWGIVKVGKISILLAGSIEEQQEFKTLLKQRL